jgi:polysaccharide deacetylase family protein (PEP-CTERM system associated)
MQNDTRQRAIFSVDVEDWFHILALPGAPDVAAWDRLPTHVERGLHRLLDVFDEAGARTTCFVLGWVAERFPGLVREAAARGHEIASHGYAHQLTYALTPDAFHDDIARTRMLLEDIVGTRVDGYRCPGFSVTRETPWFFEKVAEAGYRYDSSVFPAPRQHGGLADARLEPHAIETKAGRVIEIPISVAHVFGRPMCFFGGGYLRLFPYPVVRRMGEHVLRDGRPLMFYLHPREVLPDHPRLPMGPARRFKSYVGLRTTESKVRSILRDYHVQTFSDYLRSTPLALEAA